MSLNQGDVNVMESVLLQDGLHRGLYDARMKAAHPKTPIQNVGIKMCYEGMFQVISRVITLEF